MSQEGVKSGQEPKTPDPKTRESERRESKSREFERLSERRESERRERVREVRVQEARAPGRLRRPASAASLHSMSICVCSMLRDRPPTLCPVQLSLSQATFGIPVSTDLAFHVKWTAVAPALVS